MSDLPLAANVLRTPDERFADLVDYPFDPNYLAIADAELGKLRQHYLDEGPRTGPLVLLLHGEPTWSYLYRKMIPVLTAGGCRTIAPDLIGFGKSDKPRSRSVYSYRRMVGWMHTFLAELDLKQIHLFCQDWGGLIGLRLVAEAPERFASVVVSNSALPVGEGELPAAFRAWRRYAQYSPFFPIGSIVSRGCARPLSATAQAAYDAPFPSRRYKAAARVLPTLVPISAGDPGAIDNRAAWQSLRGFERPLLTLFGDSDPITRGNEQTLQEQVPGARGQPHEMLEQTGHFSQEDVGEALAQRLLDWVAVNGAEPPSKAPPGDAPGD